MWNSHYDNIYQYTATSGQRAMQLDEKGNQYSSGAIKEWIKRNPGETGFRLNAVTQNLVNYRFSAATYTQNVTNSGASAYTLSGTDRNGSVSGSNPTVTVYTGDQINFAMNASGHPLFIRVSNGGANVSTPAAINQGTASGGSVIWIPNTAGTYYYQCGNHSGMIGQIVVQEAPASEYIFWAIGPDNTPP